MEIRGSVVVVTGGGSGLGQVLAQGFARAGATVVVADRDVEAAQACAGVLEAEGLRAVAVAVDVTDDAQCAHLVDVAAGLGGPHVLVNNAGGWSTGPDQFPDADLARWSAAIDLNLRAPMLLTQLSRASMRACGGGVVVHVSSSAADGPSPYASPEYAATKAALVRLTTAMGGPVEPGGQRVVCVVPGWIGLPRAHEELAALPPAERAAAGALLPPDTVLAAVLDLVRDGAASGSVVRLP